MAYDDQDTAKEFFEERWDWFRVEAVPSKRSKHCVDIMLRIDGTYAGTPKDVAHMVDYFTERLLAINKREHYGRRMRGALDTVRGNT